MKSRKIFLSDLLVLAKTITNKAFRLIVLDVSGKLIKDYNTDEIEIITERKKQYFFRSAETPFLIYANLSNEKIEDDGYDAIIDFATDSIYDNLTRSQFYYISNTDGSIRWFYPQGITKPWFLHFYYEGNLKSKLFKHIVQALFAFRLGNLINSGSFRVYARKQLLTEELLKTYNRKNYAIFTGTVGPNRKIVIAGTDGLMVNRFIKIPLTAKANKNILHEFISLKSLQTETNETVITPEINLVKQEINIAEIENIKPEHDVVNTLNNSHIESLLAFYSSKDFLKVSSIPKWQFTIETEERLARIEHNLQQKKLLGSELILKKLKTLHSEILNSNKEVWVSLAHGDFTPWNSYLSKNKIFIYDWEFAGKSMPLLYDFFHYLIQPDVLLHRFNYSNIKSHIISFFKQPALQTFLKSYDIEVSFYYKLYLLHVISYHVELYQTQPKKHQQVYWLLKAWNEALADVLGSTQNGGEKTCFVSELFNQVENVKYAVLKPAQKNFYNPQSNSDIDILIDEMQLKSTADWISKHPMVQNVKFNKLHFMWCADIYFTNGDFLNIDFIFSFHRKDVSYLPAKDLLRDTMKGNGFKVLPLKYDFEYTLLFYFLNNAAIPKQYVEHFSSLATTQQEKILQHINKKFSLNINSFVEFETYNENIHATIKKYLYAGKPNNLLNRSLRSISYVLDVVKTLFKSKGMIITFSGVDGAGKTTVLEETKSILKNLYRRNVVVLRHRPSIFPILSAFKYGKENAEKRTMEFLPRTGTNKSSLSSLLRFAYYYVDYIIGQAWIHIKYVSRGYVVIYDRYYFDFIVDGKRSNLLLPKWFTKALYAFVKKPNISIFLYADAEIILQRKKELERKDITDLTKNYLQLFNSIKPAATHLDIENIDCTKTITKIIEAYKAA